MQGADSGGLMAPQRRALTVGLVLTVTFVASEALAVVTVMPVVARDLGGLRLYGWVFSGFMLGSVIGIVAAGREADRRGPAVPFVAGVALFGSGLALAGLAPSMGVLVAGRVLQGLGAGAAPSAADTPAEVLDRAAAGGLIHSSAADDLTGLFRQARYGGHDIGEPERAAAQGALARLQSDLAGPS